MVKSLFMEWFLHVASRATLADPDPTCRFASILVRDGSTLHHFFRAFTPTSQFSSSRHVAWVMFNNLSPHLCRINQHLMLFWRKNSNFEVSGCVYSWSTLLQFQRAPVIRSNSNPNLDQTSTLIGYGAKNIYLFVALLSKSTPKISAFYRKCQYCTQHRYRMITFWHICEWKTQIYPNKQHIGPFSVIQ